MMDRRVLQRGALLFVLLLAFALRIAGLTAQSLWRDEVDALRYSQEPMATLASNFFRQGWNGPLYYVCLRFWIALSGDSEFSLRYFSLCFGLLGVALTYRLGRTWFSARVGGLAALLMACSPYMVWYGQEAKMYAPLCVMVLAALLVYRHAVQCGEWYMWAAAVVLAWVTVTVHYLGGLLLPTMVVLLVVWWPTARRRWPQALLALASLFLPVIVAMPWVFPVIVQGRDLGYHAVDLRGMITVMLHVFSRGVMPSGQQGPMALALFLGLAGSALWPGAAVWSWWLWSKPSRFDRWRSVLALWAWIAVPILGLYVISLRAPMFVDRYLIWIGPAVYLLIARGLDQIRWRSVLVFVLCLATLLGLNGRSVWEQSATPFKSDFRAAAAYVQAHRQADELVLFHISYVRYTFEYYYGTSSPFADGIPTNEQTQPSTVDAEMQRRTAGYDVVWLVLSEPEMWDQRGMTVAWLDSHATAELRVDFERVSVVKYRISHAYAWLLPGVSAISPIREDQLN
jgi:4-amino-4-deoxy-L-arabinose transferase-like glycosyltransferase